MTISTNPKPAIYRILYENMGPGCNRALQQRVKTSQANARRFVLFGWFNVRPVSNNYRARRLVC